MSKYISIDVGGTGIKYALMDDTAALLDQGEFPTPKEGLDAFLDLITSIYDSTKMNIQKPWSWPLRAVLTVSTAISIPAAL